MHNPWTERLLALFIALALVAFVIGTGRIATRTTAAAKGLAKRQLTAPSAIGDGSPPPSARSPYGANVEGRDPDFRAVRLASFGHNA
jgi:hypothetical protein